MTTEKNHTYKIELDNREVTPPQRNERWEKLRTIIISGLLSVFLIAVIFITLPLTILTWEGLMVYASIVALVIFLFILLFRYFAILFFAYFYITKYTVESQSNYSPFISIIIPAYNEGINLKASVESLLKLNYSNYELIIVNDGSKDNTREVGEALVGMRNGNTSKVKVSLINKPNGGKAKALNAGIQYSEAEFVVCMDGDSVLTPNTLKTAVSHFQDPNVGAVAGNVKIANRNKWLTDLQALEYVEGLNLARSAQGHLRMVNIIPGPIGMFRKEALKDVGFYASDTFAEDADLTLKILAVGWKVNYEPNAQALTEAPIKLHQLLKQRYRWTRGILQAIRKHKKHLLNPTLNFNNTIVLWGMLYEALIWPAMNIFANIFFIAVALLNGMSSLIFYWWISIALLDFMSAVYCIAVEKEEFRLVPWALVYRMVFVLVIDITKAMATVEEFLGFEMEWGHLERSGIANKK
ncbi:MAG: glycosyltransferase [Bacteroidetes bacterium]|nr:glycosyltransferase [Bacteroidota bacterium]MBU1115291.1 glycosyltransferase [Bacteroidota bacterium]MBU1800153.1 glycosyltransferase [Bacteroidota bacterium]